MEHTKDVPCPLIAHFSWRKGGKAKGRYPIPVTAKRILIIGMVHILGTIYAGLLGLAFGSFLNVCLSRWPEGESVIAPRSHCRNCAHTLPWWENLPLVSWLVLRGRCRNCHSRIGLRYPLVELAIGALWAFSAWQLPQWGANPQSPVMEMYYGPVVLVGQMILTWLLVALAVLDADNLWLPDWITLPGAALGFAFTLLKLELLVKLTSLTGLQFTGALQHEQYGIYGIALKRLLGILAAAGMVLLIRWVYWLTRHREGIGMGDAKLMALLAAWLGLPGALLAFGLGVVMGAVLALVQLAIPSARSQSERWALSKLPLGTFLCLGGVVSSLWGQPIVAAYLRWAGF
jgi:leader peptidase (prepilin peptidase)/N-methyltransferase